jgi:hypothetical protein
LNHAQNFFWRHGMRTGLSGIAAEGAISTVIATQIGERDKNFAGVRDETGLESVTGSGGGGQKTREFLVRAANQTASGFSVERMPGL